jgi:hypothetical protein
MIGFVAHATGALAWKILLGGLVIEIIGGASQDRTGDLCSAIAALSQLSYSPTRDTGIPATGSGATLPEEHSYFNSRLWKDQANRQFCHLKNQRHWGTTADACRILSEKLL